jgi:hypothetical protein
LRGDAFLRDEFPNLPHWNYCLKLFRESIQGKVPNRWDASNSLRKRNCRRPSRVSKSPGTADVFSGSGAVQPQTCLAGIGEEKMQRPVPGGPNFLEPRGNGASRTNTSRPTNATPHAPKSRMRRSDSCGKRFLRNSANFRDSVADNFRVVSAKDFHVMAQGIINSPAIRRLPPKIASVVAFPSRVRGHRDGGKHAASAFCRAGCVARSHAG